MGKPFLCYNMDLIGQFTVNGFQIFQVDNNKADLKWAQEMTGWGPAECLWKDDKTIYIKADYMDSDDVKTKYLSLKIPEFK